MTDSSFTADTAAPNCEGALLPTTNQTAAIDPLGAERRAYEIFARHHTTLEYRDLLSDKYAEWHQSNERFFENRLVVPHIGIGQTHARRFSHCRQTTNYGGSLEITLSERIAFGTDRRIVVEAWPSLGVRRFLSDLLLGETVKQSILEGTGNTEDGYGGYGPLFAAEATRIGPMIGLPEGEVMARRRGYRGRGEPVAAFWPWAFRDESYYLGHVSLSHLQIAGLRPRPVNQSAIPGVYDYLLYLATTNQTVRLIDVLGRQVDADLESRSPAVAAFERTPHDPSGMPLPDPLIDRDWLSWNGGCVRAMAEGILSRRAFDGMPILADALQDAGCEDPIILGHCRAHSHHTSACWVLRLLTEPERT
jgi:hypothetical protein